MGDVWQHLKNKQYVSFCIIGIIISARVRFYLAVFHFPILCYNKQKKLYKNMSPKTAILILLALSAISFGGFYYLYSYPMFPQEMPAKQPAGISETPAKSSTSSSVVPQQEDMFNREQEKEKKIRKIEEAEKKIEAINSQLNDGIPKEYAKQLKQEQIDDILEEAIKKEPQTGEQTVKTNTVSDEEMEALLKKK